ncbi:MAG: hypothetical protein AMXMBFR12_09020 [Candidatus Babeliales bacterium]
MSASLHEQRSLTLQNQVPISKTHVSFAELIQLTKVYENINQIPASLLLARGCTITPQPPITPMPLAPTHTNPIRNATVDFSKQSTSNSHIPAQNSGNYSCISPERLINITRSTNSVGRQISGLEYINQRQNSFKISSDYLSKHPHGREAFEVRKEMVQQEILNAIGILRDAIKPALSKQFNEHAAAATEAWYKLPSLTLSVPELNESLKKTIGEIQNMTGGDNKHTQPLFLPSGAYSDIQKKLDKCVASFENDALKWLNKDYEFNTTCADQAERFIRQYYEELTVNPSKIYDQQSWDFLNSPNKPINLAEHKQIVNHPTYSTFQTVEQLLKRGNFHEARKHCFQLEPGIDSACIGAVYRKHFYEKYTIECIEKRFINNSYYLEKKQELAQSLNANECFPIPHEFNHFLAQTEKAYHTNKAALGITKSNPVLDDIIYRLCEIPNNSQDLASFINSYGLSSDHADPLKREAYQQLHSHGVLKIFNTNAEWLNDMPSSIGLAQYHNERELLNNVIAHSITNKTDIQLVKNTADYLKMAIQSIPEASQYRTLANASAQAIFNPTTNRAIASLANYATPSANIHHQQLQKAAVKLIAENINFIKSADPKNPNIPECWDVIHKIDNAYKALQQNDIRAEFYLEKALTPAINTEILKVDYDSQMAHFAGINQDQIVAHIQTRKDVTEILLKNGAQYELKQYELPSTIKEFLVSQGLDPKKFENCYGHQVQQAIHLDILRQVVKQKDLSGLALINSSGLYKLRDLSTKVTDLSRQHNSLGNIEQAGMLSNFCWQIMNHIETTGKYGIDTIVGAGKGVIKGTQSAIHSITHPHEVIEGFFNLGKTALKVAEAHEHLENISPFRPLEENLKLETQFKQACKESGLPALGKQIAHRLKNGTWQDNVRDVTAVIVENAIIGEVIPATGKIIGEVGALVEKTGIHTKALAQRLAHDFKVPVTSVTTTEGIEIKVATDAIKNAVKQDAVTCANSKTIQDTINQTSTAVLKNGYYEVNGFKFTKYYYERTWNTGRGAPSLVAKEILDHATNAIVDSRPGFFRYEYGDWELIYNPQTKEIWHIQPIK